MMGADCWRSVQEKQKENRAPSSSSSSSPQIFQRSGVKKLIIPTTRMKACLIVPPSTATSVETSRGGVVERLSFAVAESYTVSCDVAGQGRVTSITHLKRLADANDAVLENLTVTSVYGSVCWPGVVDVNENVKLGDVVIMGPSFVEVYPDESTKPTSGTGLNRRATITLNDVYPKIPSHDETKFVRKLQKANAKAACEFESYENGVWTFTAPGF